MAQRRGAPESQRRESGRPVGTTQTKKPNEALEWLKSFAIAVLLFFPIPTFLIQAFTIPSGSMENTLRVGDYLMANNAIFGAQIPFTEIRVPAFRDPEFSDVVVFRPTYNDPI